MKKKKISFYIISFKIKKNINYRIKMNSSTLESFISTINPADTTWVLVSKIFCI